MTPRSKQLVITVGLGVFLTIYGCSQLGGTWKEVAPLPNPRWFHGAALGGDGKIYVMGGQTLERGSIYPKWGVGTNAMVVYDPQADRWEKHTLMLVSESFETEAKRRRLWTWRWNTRDIDEPHLLDDQGLEKLRRYGAGLQQGPTTDDLVFKEFAIFSPVKGIIRFGKMNMNDTSLAVAADHQGNVYWIGGGEVWGTTNAVYVFDTKTHQALEDVMAGPPPMLYARSDHTATTGPDGKIYVVGGYLVDLDPATYDPLRLLNNLEVYDPVANTWMERAPLHNARQMHAAAFGPDGKLYVFGGYHGVGRYKHNLKDPDDAKKMEEALQYARRALDSVESYDPVTDTWMEKTPMPFPRQNMGAALGGDGKIYVVGGFESFSGSTPQKDVQIYDPRTDRWAKGPSLHTPRGDHAVVATPDGKVYVIGGTDRIETASIGMLFGGEPNIKGDILASVEALDSVRLSR